jgi:hypothetical protein
MLIEEREQRRVEKGKVPMRGKRELMIEERDGEG